MFSKIVCLTFQIYNNVNMYNVIVVHIMIKGYFNVNYSTSMGNSTLYCVHNISGYFK